MLSHTDETNFPIFAFVFSPASISFLPTFVFGNAEPTPPDIATSVQSISSLLASELPHLLLLLLLPLLPLSSLPALLSAFRLPLLLLFLLSLQEMLLLQHVKSFLYSSVIVIKSIFNIRLHFLINYPYHQLIYFHLPVRFMTFIDYNLFIFCICLHTKARIMIYSWLSISKIVSE